MNNCGRFLKRAEEQDDHPSVLGRILGIPAGALVGLTGGPFGSIRGAVSGGMGGGNSVMDSLLYGPGTSLGIQTKRLKANPRKSASYRRSDMSINKWALAQKLKKQASIHRARAAALRQGDFEKAASLQKAALNPAALLSAGKALGGKALGAAKSVGGKALGAAKGVGGQAKNNFGALGNEMSALAGRGSQGLAEMAGRTEGMLGKGLMAGSKALGAGAGLAAKNPVLTGAGLAGLGSAGTAYGINQMRQGNYSGIVGQQGQ